METDCSSSCWPISAVDLKRVKRWMDTCSKPSDFSIEYILSASGPGNGYNHDSDVTVAVAAAEEDDDNDSSHSSPHPKFDWLRCTRYRPPKLQRVRRKEGRQRRKLGRNPRIPFTGTQVAVLEDRFRLGHYLSSSEVERLSALLGLSETRVKIWFQNRRARERRERDVDAHQEISSRNEGETRLEEDDQQKESSARTCFITSRVTNAPLISSFRSAFSPCRRPLFYDSGGDKKTVVPSYFSSSLVNHRRVLIEESVD